MNLLYGYDWSTRKHKIVPGAGPRPTWSREYADAVLAGKEDSVLVSVFTAPEPPLVQVRINSEGLGFTVLWIADSGRPELQYEFVARTPGFRDADFPSSAAIREGEMFLRSVTKTFVGDPERSGVTCQRRFRTDGSVQDQYTWDFFDKPPLLDSGAREVDTSLNMLGDGFWHPPLTSLGFDDIEGLLVRDRPGVDASFELPVHPNDR